MLNTCPKTPSLTTERQTRAGSRVAFFLTASAAATLALIGAAHATPVTGAYGDFGDYWYSSTAAPSAIQPNNHNNLLAFTVNGVTYSTGVNDARLTNDGVTFTAGSYQAFTPSTLPTPNVSTYIGVGTNWEGQPQTATSTTIPGSTAPLSSYLSDGSKGLDLASAVFNLPAGDIKFPVTISASAAALTGSVPAIVATQMGDPGTSDTFRFVDATGNVVGNPVSVNFSTTPAVGTQSWAFFSAAPPHDYAAVNSGASGPIRRVRLQSFTLADFGITAANVAQVTGFEQTLSGQSDVAFVAYNNRLITVAAPPGAPGAASVTAVPALGELSLLSLGALLAGAGVAATRRRRQQS